VGHEIKRIGGPPHKGTHTTGATRSKGEKGVVRVRNPSVYNLWKNINISNGSQEAKTPKAKKKPGRKQGRVGGGKKTAGLVGKTVWTCATKQSPRNGAIDDCFGRRCKSANHGQIEGRARRQVQKTNKPSSPRIT